MKWPKKCCVLILAATVVAFSLCLPRLRQRPMHGDEAVHAVKFGDLLERGDYTYDPNEFHGPMLNYLTLVPAWLASAETLTEISEFTLRIVPVFFAVLMVLGLLLLVDGLGRAAAVCAALLNALSPAMVFYSRYYIQEMLLVSFTFGVIVFGYRYTKSENILWAILTGVCLGLVHATKETCIIAFGSIFLAIVLVLMLRCQQDGHRGFIKTLKTIKGSHFIAGLLAAMVVSVLFFTSFFDNPRGILDSVLTYGTYFDRASQNEIHQHPWYYYLKMLLFFKYGEGPVWSEALIVFLAVVGFIVAMIRKGISAVDFHLLRFIAFYTLTMTIIYSVIRYKTPWCMLGFLHGMILLAGVGAVALVKLVPKVVPRLIVVGLLIAASAHLGFQAYRASFVSYADSRNPYVYAHPTTDVLTVARQTEEMAEVLKRLAEEEPNDVEMHIQVICPGHDYWPLPWYLRRIEKCAVRWRDIVADDVPAASIIIASPDMEQELLRKLYELPPPGKRNLYVPLFDTDMYLRPKVELRGYVRKDLWDRSVNREVPDVVDSITGKKNEK